MKKNVWYVMLLMAAMFAGCAAERDGQNAAVNNSKASVNPDSIPVAFDAYQNRTISRSGWAGVLDNDQLKETKANGGGFGVFAYYTDLKNYDQSYVPNFMYNRGVFYNGADGTSGTNVWEYTPIAYWPNEYGFDAASDDEDHLSFFAYAPYTQHTSAAAGSVADATYGIVGFSRNTATGDPMVRYIASFDPEKSVDLCWGVVPADKTDWPKIQGGGSQTLAAGFPYLNMERPLETATQTGASSASRIKFKFNHALAQLNVQIDTDADVTTHADSGDELDDATKVYVRSISFTGIALQGALNLNNSVKDQALWLDWCGCTDLAYGQSVTVHDGRRDSREGVAGAEATNETPTGLNPNIIQNSYATDGVTHEYQNLFNPTSTDPADQLNDAICVIPTGESMTITIVYDIETENPKLAGYLSDGTTHGLSIENRVTKTITFGGVAGAGLESNKRYALKLHLGMNSVKFDAEVSDWATNTVNGEGWLPSNVRPITLNHTVMYLGAAQNLIATTDPTGQSVTWTNSDPSVVTLGGLVASSRGGTRAVTTLPGTWSTVSVTPVALGDATITASLASGDKAVCEVHVVPITLTSTNVSIPNIAITETFGQGTNITLNAVTFPASGTVSWTSSDPSVATVSWSGSYNETCTVNGIAAGTATITCTFGVATATCTVTVASLALNKASTSIGLGNNEMLTVTSNSLGESIVWSSSNPSIATVDASGKVTGVSVGTATITATGAQSGATATCMVYINSITLNKSTLSLNGSYYEILVATINSPNSETVTWSIPSGDSDIAYVDSSTGEVTGISTGTTTVTAKISSSGADADCALTVTSWPLTSAVAADLGKVVGDDGNIYREHTSKTKYVKSGVIAEAMIAYVGTTDAYPAVTTGLAIALEDATSATLSNAVSNVSSWSSSHSVSSGTWRVPTMWDFAAMLRSFGGSGVISISTPAPPSFNLTTTGTTNSSNLYTGDMGFTYGTFDSKVQAAGGNAFTSGPQGYALNTIPTNGNPRVYMFATPAFDGQTSTATLDVRYVLAF